MSNGGGKGRGPSVLRTLSTRPEVMWPDAVLHHGARIVLLVVVAVVITAIFPPVTPLTVGRYDVASLVEEDLVAQAPFSVPKSADELGRDRDAAAAAVPPTFDFRAAAPDTMTDRIAGFFDAADSAAAMGGAGALDDLFDRVGIDARESQLTVLAEDGFRALLREAALEAAGDLLREGVISAESEITTDRIAVRMEEQDRGYIPRSRLMAQGEFLAAADSLLGDQASTDASDLLRLILIRFQEYNYTLNAMATDEDRNQARGAVDPTKENILRGQVIVRAGDQIGEADVERLDAYETQLRTLGLMEGEGVAFLPFVGFTLVAALLLAVFGFLVFFFRAEIYTNYVWLLLQAALITAYFLVAGVINWNGFAPELLPIAFVALGVAVLWDGRMALVLILLLALLTGALPAFEDYGIVLSVTAGGAAAALSVRAVRRRAQTWIFIAIITAAYAAIILATGLVEAEAPGALVRAILWAGANATASAILAMGFLPVFEWITGITTDQTLLEFADPNRSLLKRLSMEAPGTHAHSIQVANLAEAGASAIGANGLLCRVGAYYHDIGKVLKPQYFIENQPHGRNPHDKLKPLTSAQVVREHVTEGLRLAREAKVPNAIADFIAQHHGTQRIQYFYQKALTESEGSAVDPEQFSYPGPRPQSRETAVIMLADSVESATRVLQDATPERIRDLVHNIVESKVGESQLDEADLTLREIAALEDQFVKILGSQHHHRIDYPTTRHLTEAPESENGAGVTPESANVDEEDAPEADQAPNFPGFDQ